MLGNFKGNKTTIQLQLQVTESVTSFPQITSIMLYTHTIGRIGKDCKVITGVHGTFMAVDIAVDDYSRGQNITTWVRVRSSRENHIRLADYLTKGRLILVEGTISTSLWKDRQGESHIQVSINADSIAFVNAGRKEEQSANPKQASKKGAKAKNTPEPPKDAPEAKADDLPF